MHDLLKPARPGAAAEAIAAERWERGGTRLRVFTPAGEAGPGERETLRGLALAALADEGAALLRGFGAEEAWAYFVHSYAVPVGEWTLASSEYGGAFSSVIARGNFHGAQFHPERSAKVGARLLKNFLEL